MWYFLFLFCSCALLANSPQGTSENESWHIEDFVNVITGRISLSEEDLIVEGAEPIYLRRHLTDKKEGGIRRGSIYFPHTRMIVTSSTIETCEPSGAGVIYDWSDKGNCYRFKAEKDHSQGFTNTSKGDISGRTNLKNNRIYKKKDETLHMICADGTHRYYYKKRSLKKKISYVYLLEKEQLPNGNWFTYEYDKDERLEQVFSKNPNQNKCYAWVKFAYKHSYDTSNDFEVETIDARKFSLEFDKHSKSAPKKFYSLLKVQNPEKGEEEYQYSKHNWLAVKHIKTYDDREINLEFYESGINTVGDIKVKVEKYDDREDRVKLLKSAIGRDEQQHTFYRLFYHVAKDKKKKWYDYAGKTIVHDANNNITEYSFTENNLPQEIKRFSQDGSLIHREEYHWQEYTDLKCKKLFDGNGREISSKTYEYDDRYNIKKEHTQGNLTGEGASTYTISYEYNERNLLTCASEPNGKSVYYTYLRDTDRIASRLTLVQGRILIREFFEYDADNLLIASFTDDGSSEHKDDLTNVTQRTIKRIQRKQSYPALGLPEIIEEKYLENGQEKLLKKTVYHYNGQSRIEDRDICDANDNFCYKLTTRYNHKGQVINETDALGHLTTYEYDSRGNQYLVTEQGGRKITERSFDRSNRPYQIIEKADNLSRITQYEYDLKGNLISTTNPFGAKTRFIPDAFGRTLETHLPDGNKISKTFDGTGNETSSTDTYGATSRMEYNAYGKPCLIIHPDGYQETFRYHPDGSLHIATDVLGTTTHHEYDPLGRVSQKTVYDSHGELLTQEKWIYSSFQLKTYIDAAGYVTTFDYDGAGRKIAETREGQRTEYSYDPLGRIQTTKKNDLLTIRNYNYLDQLIEEREEDLSGKILSQSHMTYDLGGNRATITTLASSGVSIHRTDYDTRGRAIRITDSLDQTTLIRYSDDPKQTITTDSMGFITIETFDFMDRVKRIERKDILGEILYASENEYDSAGKLIHKVNISSSKKIETTWEYNRLGQLIKLIEADKSYYSKVTQYTYTPKGQIHTLTKPDGKVLTHSYDPLGRLQDLQSSDCHYRFRYNKQNLLTETEDLINNTLSKRTHDAHGNVLTELLANGLHLISTYDSQNRRESLTLPDHSYIRYVYDASHLIAIERYKPSHKLVYTHRYLKFGPDHKLLQESLIGDLGVIQYESDSEGRTTSLNSPYANLQITKYDPDGNVIILQKDDETVKYDYDAHNHLTSEPDHIYAYDSLGNRISHNNRSYPIDDLNRIASYKYDPNGCPIKKGKWTYNYDIFDRLISAESDTIRLIFTYDSSHRRLSKTVFAKQNDQWQQTTHQLFLYDDQNEIGAIEHGHITQLRVLGIGKGAEIGAAISIECDNQVFAPIHDLSGNVWKLISLSDHSVHTNKYSAFGEETDCFHSNPWRFSSKRIDEETGLVFYGRRYYDPSAGRWLTPDPQGFGDGMNLYCYVKNNPLICLDLYGLMGEFRLQLYGDSPMQLGFQPQNCPTIPLFNTGPLVRGALTLTGKMIIAAGQHIVPELMGGAFVRALGRVFCGKFYWKSRQKSKIISAGTEEGQDFRVVSVSGMLVTAHDAKEYTETISDSFGDTRVDHLHDSSRGFLRDLTDSIAGILGVTLEESKMLRDLIRKNIQELGGIDGGGTVYLFAHSQGGITAKNALNMLTKEERRMVEVFTFGSASLFGKKYGREVHHNVAVRDIVPIIGDLYHYIKGAFGFSGNINFVGSAKGIPFIDHSFQSNTYSEILREICIKIRTKHLESK